MFELDHHGEVTSIRYNNDDRGSLSHLDRAAIERFYPAWRKVTTMLRAERSKLEILLEPGTLLIVNNHRVLHGRTEFLGRRNLVGCYLDRDMFDGRRRVLNSATEPAVWAE
jgi:trimethyllysine dioxygenase